MRKHFFHFYRLHVVLVCSVLLTALICSFSFSTLHATNYYVDNITGNNANNGTSAGTAWFDFTNINSRTFVAGDQILLKAGCVWNSELYLKGSGNSTNFIILDSYGSGSKPKIQRNNQVSDRTVFMDDVSYFKVRNLEICNAGDGIRLKYTIKGKTSVYFENLYIHNIDLIVNASPATTGFTFSNNTTGSFNNPNLAREKAYSSSSVYDATQRAAKAFDGSGSTNWQAASGFANQWLRINFGSAVTFDSVRLSEFGNRTTSYRIEYSPNGVTWQTAYTGTTIGANRAISFTPVTGNMIRLFFTGGSNAPIIYEFEVYKKPEGGVGNNLALNRTYNSSSNWDATQTAEKGCDALTNTNWQAASGSTFNGQWLRVNFGTAVTFNRVTLKEFGNRTTGYRIEYSANGTTWQTAFTGTTIGASITVNFTSVSANYARVFFTAGANTPIIYEFEIYNITGVNRMAGSEPLVEVSNYRQLTIYPNPGSGIINLAYRLPVRSLAKIYVYNVEGRLLKQQSFVTADTEFGRISVDLRALSNGNYVIRLSANNKSLTHRIAIEK